MIMAGVAKIVRYAVYRAFINGMIGVPGRWPKLYNAGA